MYSFFYRIFIEGPRTHGDLEKLGKQVGIEVKEWTTPEESIT